MARGIRNNFEVGQRFGAWIVQSSSLDRSDPKNVKVYCACSCKKTTKWIVAKRLMSGQSTQCVLCSNLGKTKPVINVETGELFARSAAAAAKYFVSPNSIKAAISDQGTSAGYHWIYEDEDEKKKKKKKVASKPKKTNRKK